VDGFLSAWGNWSECTSTCGGGNRSRDRQCLFDPLAPQGADCVDDLTDYQSCNTDLCPGMLSLELDEQW